MLNRFELPAHGADKPTGHSRDSGSLDETALETDLHIEKALKAVEEDDALCALAAGQELGEESHRLRHAADGEAHQEA